MRTADLDLATLWCEQDGRVLTVRVVAPPFNYMIAPMQDDLVRLVAAVGADESVGAVVLTGGVPGRYITHFDIADLLHSAEILPPALPRPPVSAVVRAIKRISAVGGKPVRRLLDRTPLASLGLLARFHTACEAILRSPAVWIAAVDGPCGGGGLEVSTFFDVRLASRDAHFMLPELTIGLTTTFGGQRRWVWSTASSTAMCSRRPRSSRPATRSGPDRWSRRRRPSSTTTSRSRRA